MPFVLFAGAARELWLLCSLQPTHFVIVARAAMRATETGGFRFLLLVKKIAFVQKVCGFAAATCRFSNLSIVLIKRLESIDFASIGS